VTPAFEHFLFWFCVLVALLSFVRAAQFLGQIAESASDIWLKLDDIYAYLLYDDEDDAAGQTTDGVNKSEPSSPVPPEKEV
jgi:hypothetical protein